MQHFKMSTSRDFRINAASLQAAMEQAAAADDAESNDSDAGADSDDQVIDLILRVIFSSIFSFSLHRYFAQNLFLELNGLLCADVPLRNYSLTHSCN